MCTYYDDSVPDKFDVFCQRNNKFDNWNALQRNDFHVEFYA